MPWTTRISGADDVPGIVRLIERTSVGEESPVGLADVVADLRSPSTNIVACVGETIVGAMLGRVEGDIGRIVTIATDDLLATLATAVPTISPQDPATFDGEVESFSRL